MLMQASAVTDSVALVIAIVTAIGTIGAIITSVANRIKVSSHDTRITKAAGEIASVGQLATAFAQKTAEQQGELQTVAEVITSLSPEAKAVLESKDKDINYWKERATVANAQLNRLLPIVDAKGQANAIVNLPREKKATSAV